MRPGWRRGGRGGGGPRRGVCAYRGRRGRGQESPALGGGLGGESVHVNVTLRRLELAGTCAAATADFA